MISAVEVVIVNNQKKVIQLKLYDPFSFRLFFILFLLEKQNLCL